MYPKFPNRRTVHSSEVLIVNEIQDFKDIIQATSVKSLSFPSLVYWKYKLFKTRKHSPKENWRAQVSWFRNF